MLQIPLPPSHRPWSKNYTILVIVFSLGIWFFYSLISPGTDFYGAYTWIVTEPERIQEAAQYPWTLSPPWMASFLAPFVTMPNNAGLVAFLGMSIAMTVLGCYVFGGRPIITLLSAQMWWILWWGQLEGIEIFALVLGWYALTNMSWVIMFLSLAIGSFKPQVSFIPLTALWWWTGKERWKSLAAMFVLLGLSIWIWGPWPLWYLEGVSKFVGDQHFSGWNSSIGLIALPLYLPALLVDLPKEKRLLALAATTMLVSPYLPYYSTLPLFIFNLPGWAYIFAFTGYLPAFIDSNLPWNSLVLLPLGILVWLYLPAIQNGYAMLMQRINERGKVTIQ